MRFLLVNQFYPPDMAPTGQVLHDLAQVLGRRGHEVHVICSRWSYNGSGKYAAREIVDDIPVRRLSAFALGKGGTARAVEYLAFHAALLVGVRSSERFDLTLSLTTPPYLGWTLAHSLGLRARRHANWVMDLYPDVLAAHGVLSTRNAAYRLLSSVARWQMARTELVIALGPRMATRARAYASRRTQVVWVPLWGAAEGGTVSPTAVSTLRSRRGWSAGDCVLLYSGNMGLGHRLDEFLAAAGRLGKDGPVWAFAGGGFRRPEVESFVSRHAASRVQLLPYVQQADLGSSLAGADVHLVSLRDEWKGLIVPSKLQAAFSVGRPVIFVGPHDSEPADWVLESGGGWVVREGDVDGVVRAVGEALNEPERMRRGLAALAYAREHFDCRRNSVRIAELLENASAP